MDQWTLIGRLSPKVVILSRGGIVQTIMRTTRLLLILLPLLAFLAACTVRARATVRVEHGSSPTTGRIDAPPPPPSTNPADAPPPSTNPADAPPPPPQAPSPRSLAQGQACTASTQCGEGLTCAGEPGCGRPWSCQPAHPCTRDLVPFCGCDGRVFRSSSSCPGRPHRSRGVCANSTPPPPPTSSPVANGGACSSSSQCADGLMCVGREGCANGASCQPSRPCTLDLMPFCGCDGATFRGSSTCPARAYRHRGACESDGPLPQIPRNPNEGG